MFGDGLEALRALNVHNLYNAHLIAPSFHAVPWYADHDSNPDRRYEGFLVNDATLEITPDGLRGQVRGRSNARDAIVTEVKSATYHDLVVRNDGGRWFARVVMDV